MTADGIGIAAVPEAMVRNELATGQLFRIDYGWAPEALRFLARFDKERAPQFVAKTAMVASDVATRFVDSLSH